MAHSIEAAGARPRRSTPSGGKTLYKATSLAGENVIVRERMDKGLVISMHVGGKQACQQRVGIISKETASEVMVFLAKFFLRGEVEHVRGGELYNERDRLLMKVDLDDDDDLDAGHQGEVHKCPSANTDHAESDIDESSSSSPSRDGEHVIDDDVDQDPGPKAALKHPAAMTAAGSEPSNKKPSRSISNRSTDFGHDATLYQMKGPPEVGLFGAFV